MSPSSLSGYLSLLTNNGLLRQHYEKQELYLTTPKGRELLQVLAQLAELEKRQVL